MRGRDLLSWAIYAGLFAQIGACEGRAASTFEVHVRVESDPDKPLAGARVSSRGQELGESDATGLVKLRLPGQPGDMVVIDTTCPPTYRPPEAPLSVVLRPIAEGKSPEFRVRCQPLTRKLVVSVRTQNGANLPVRYLGKEIARTDANGAAHALLEAAPGETVTVTLDTTHPEHQKLMPQNPELKVVVTDRDDVVVFDQSFQVPAEPKAKKRRRPKRTGPQKIGSRHH